MNAEPISGIEWCAAHDDFAIEGYDWADICHTAWQDDPDDPDDAGCDLRPLYRSDQLEPVARWLCDIGYPIDWQTDEPPPDPIRPYIEQAWVDADGLDGDDAATCRAIIAEEGGWA